MSKFRALIASALLATVVVGGAATATSTVDAKPAQVSRVGGSYCC